MFQVSRTPLREALQCLENESFLTRLPSGSLIVAPLSLEYVDNLFNVRAVVEAQIAKEAVDRMKAEHLKTMEIILEEMIVAAKMKSPDNIAKKGFMFHKILEEVSGNKVASDILNKLNDQIQRYRNVGLRGDIFRNEKAIEEHKEIYNAILSKDKEYVFKIMYDHIINSKKSIIKALQKVIE